MKGKFQKWTIALLLVFLLVFSAEAEGVILINGDLEPKTREETLAMLSAMADVYDQDEAVAAELSGEIELNEIPDPFGMDESETITICSLTHGGQTMRFLMDIIGEPDENGLYPLYLTLHGGGEDVPEGNDEQWMSMYYYYRSAVQNGIYIACRGITDTWDLHFRPESYPLYDRLIQAMIRLYRADPNRVYLLGFSAGGDGVYQIAPRMADRFAAANMSSGHPNGVSLRNMMNCPFSIQVGVYDYYSESALRCIRGAEFDQVLNAYHDQYGYGYEHQVLVHVPAGHNYNDFSDEEEAEVLVNPTVYANPEIVDTMMDCFLDALQSILREDDVSFLSYYPAGENAAFDQAVRKIVKEDFQLETTFVNANAVDYVSRFTRNPAPDTVVWDLSTRAASREVDSFYWLKADASVTEGTIAAYLDAENNTIRVNPENVNGDFSILVNPALLDVENPIHIITPEGEFEVLVHPSEETMLASILETGDPTLAWAAEIPYSLLHE